MKSSDEQIIKWYMYGYEDASFGTSRISSENPLLIESYKLGRTHVSSDRKYNALSEEEILSIITKQ